MRAYNPTARASSSSPRTGKRCAGVPARHRRLVATVKHPRLVAGPTAPDAHLGARGASTAGPTPGGGTQGHPDDQFENAALRSRDAAPREGPGTLGADSCSPSTPASSFRRSILQPLRGLSAALEPTGPPLQVVPVPFLRWQPVGVDTSPPLARGPSSWGGPWILLMGSDGALSLSTGRGSPLSLSTGLTAVHPPMTQVPCGGLYHRHSGSPHAPPPRWYHRSTASAWAQRSRGSACLALALGDCSSRWPVRPGTRPSSRRDHHGPGSRKTAPLEVAVPARAAAPQTFKQAAASRGPEPRLPLHGTFRLRPGAPYEPALGDACWSPSSPARRSV